MNFNYNIDNYDKNELREMFELPENYDENMLDSKEIKLRESILKDKNVGENTQAKVLNFLFKAKNVLLVNSEKQLDNTKHNNYENSNDYVNKQLLKKYDDVYNVKLDRQRKTALVTTDEHMIQTKNRDTPYVVSYPSESFPGDVNPIRRRIRRVNLVVDTRFRDNYYNSASTNFNFQVPMVLERVLSMQLTGIEFPLSYNVISKQYNNNFFSIIITNNEGVSEGKVITIPDGNYDYDSFPLILKTQLLAIGSPFKYLNFVINISSGVNCASSGSGTRQMMVGFDSTTPQDVIDSISSFELNFQADRYGNEDRTTPLTLKLGWLMGFRNGIYTNGKNYVSEGCVDLVGPKYLYLVIDDFNNNNNNGLYYGAFNSSILNKNIIARITLTTKLFNVLIPDNTGLITLQREYYGPVNIRNFQIQVLDEFGRVFDLNYMDFSFCLAFTIGYEKN
jgi:hypothetical protein